MHAAVARVMVSNSEGTTMKQLSISTVLHKILPVVFLAGLMTAFMSQANASDWPRFRGPNGAGISNDTGVPTEIGVSKNLLWKVEIPGLGNSSPIVAKQRIFLQTASNDGRKRLILCLDLTNGKQLWSQSFSGETAHTHNKNTLASGSGATDDTHVYMPFWDGHRLALSAYDFDGKPAWTTDLGPFPGGQHGAGHSPIVLGGKVILANDQDGLAEVIGVDAAKGDVAWRTLRKPFRSSFSTPIVWERPGLPPEILVTSTDGVSGYDLHGAEKWRWIWESNTIPLRTVGSAILSQGMVFFTGGNGPGDRHAVAVDLGPKAGPPSPKLAWEIKKDFPYVPCMLSRGDHLYFINDLGIAGCYVAKTGAKVWNNRLPECGGVTSSPVMVENRIYAFSENGHAFVFAAEPKFELLASAHLDEG
ncbi:MAG TPA: PQQ-binding-like beta-propeller repeat protein, partial [Planctomycetaceae bacterium]